MNDWNPHGYVEQCELVYQVGYPDRYSSGLGLKGIEGHITHIIMKPDVQSGCRVGGLFGWRSKKVMKLGGEYLAFFLSIIQCV